MGSYSIGEALNLLLEKSHWKPKVVELRMRDGKKLTIYTDVAPLKQELLLGKEQLIARINEYFEDKVVDEIIIK